MSCVRRGRLPQEPQLHETAMIYSSEVRVHGAWGTQHPIGASIYGKGVRGEARDYDYLPEEKMNRSSGVSPWRDGEGGSGPGWNSPRLGGRCHVPPKTVAWTRKNRSLVPLDNGLS